MSSTLVSSPGIPQTPVKSFTAFRNSSSSLPDIIPSSLYRRTKISIENVGISVGEIDGNGDGKRDGFDVG